MDNAVKMMGIDNPARSTRTVRMIDTRVYFFISNSVPAGRANAKVQKLTIQP